MTILNYWKQVLGLVALVALGLWAWDFLGPGQTHRAAMQQAAAHAAVAALEKKDARTEVAHADATRVVLDQRSRPVQAAAQRILQSAPKVEVQVQALPDPVEALGLVRDARELAGLSLAQEQDRRQEEAAYQSAVHHYELALDEKTQENAILRTEAAKPRLTLPKVVGLVLLGAACGWGAAALF